MVLPSLSTNALKASMCFRINRAFGSPKLNGYLVFLFIANVGLPLKESMLAVECSTSNRLRTVSDICSVSSLCVCAFTLILFTVVVWAGWGSNPGPVA